jgi:RNA recognition motif-containing protein
LAQGERKLRQAFSSFGTVVSINTRRKDMLDGKHKSWALITFADRKSARKVLRDSVQVMAEEGPVELDVKVAQVGAQRSNPGPQQPFLPCASCAAMMGWNGGEVDRWWCRMFPVCCGCG